MNVELASPLDFLPALEGWRERSRFRFREGNLDVFDFSTKQVEPAKLGISMRASRLSCTGSPR